MTGRRHILVPTSNNGSTYYKAQWYMLSSTRSKYIKNLHILSLLSGCLSGASIQRRWVKGLCLKLFALHWYQFCISSIYHSAFPLQESGGPPFLSLLLFSLVTCILCLLWCMNDSRLIRAGNALDLKHWRQPKHFRFTIWKAFRATKAS